MSTSHEHPMMEAMVAPTPSSLLANVDVNAAFADIVRNEGQRLYSVEAAAIVGRLDRSDHALTDRIEAAILLAAPHITSTRDSIWTIEVQTDQRVVITSVAGTSSLASTVLSNELAGLHSEFFAD